MGIDNVGSLSTLRDWSAGNPSTSRIKFGRAKINLHSANETNETAGVLKKAFAGMEQTLLSMKKVAELAQRDGMSDEDRINLQIDMTKLQTKLFKSIYRMSLEMYPGIDSQKVEQSVNAINHSESRLLDFLQSAKDKIRSGDYTPGTDGVDLSALSIIKGDNLTKMVFKGEISDKGYDAELVDNANGLTSSVFSVGIVVTNKGTAQESQERIEDKLALVSDLKKDFEKICESGEDAAGDDGAFVEPELEFVGGGPVISDYPLPTGILARNSFNIDDPRDPTDSQNYPGVADSPVYYDMRMQNPRNKLEAFLQKADAIFKDKVFGALGFVERGLDYAKSKNQVSGRNVDLRI